jgi:hypothetical protein
MKWLDWHGSSALTGLSHLVEAEANPKASSTGGIAIDLFDDSDKADDQLGRENATPAPIVQPPAGRERSIQRVGTRNVWHVRCESWTPSTIRPTRARTRMRQFHK